MANQFQEDNYHLQGGNNYSSQNFSRNQKIAAGVLAVFAFIVILIWSVQFKRSLIFVPAPSGNIAGNDTASTSQKNISEQYSRDSDTDKDGLSDWDEANIYSTSPFLDDTDGDTKKDGDEIKNGADPNCPEGRKCYPKVDNTAGNSLESDNQSAGTDISSVDAQNNTASSPTGSGLINTGTDSNTNMSGSNLDKDLANQILSGQTNAKDLRAALIAAGMDKGLLDKISDEQLMQSYKDTLKKSSNN